MFISCNNKTAESTDNSNVEEATNLEELKEKYGNHEFADCDEFLAAGDEMIDVYLATIDRAYEGDSAAKRDLDRFDTFMNRYDALAEEFATECPEQFEDWAEKTDIRVSEASDKLFEIYMLDYSDDVFEYDEELEKELEEDLEELNEQVEKALQDEII
ncbi:MAG: hypothetical protein C0596_17370 [Marinilabiliales bacterium]|nr:MAG: hypothetical protein C0596_17370 [Marinilabiliales bacterium]